MPIVYSEEAQRKVRSLIDLYWPFESGQGLLKRPGILEPAEVLMAGWGCPRLDSTILDAAPNLDAVFYAAGTVEPIVSQALWERGITLTCANEANAIAVADFTVAEIVFSLKHGWYFHREFTRRRSAGLRSLWRYRLQSRGTYGSTVGVVSVGAIGRRVCELLRSYEVEVIAHDPFLSPGEGNALGVTMVSLGELFAESDVVSLHTPLLDSTDGMVTGALVKTMKPHATLINTARGRLIREDELIRVLKRRRDLTAVLDVTATEPLEKSSPLFDMRNVILTPHVAGSHMHECWRLGDYMVEELERYVKGEPLKWAVSRERAESMGRFSGGEDA